MLKDKISKEQFFEYLNGLRDRSNYIDDVYASSRRFINILELNDFLIRPYMILEKLFFSAEENDIIGWYLWENVEKKIYDLESKEVIVELNDDEALWEYLNRE